MLMDSTLLALVAAHLVADFPLQPDWMVAHKRDPRVLLLHLVVIVVAAGVILGAAPWKPLAILAATHLAMDALKVYVLKDRLWTFLLDQAVHLAVLIGLAVAFPDIWRTGVWPWLFPDGQGLFLAGLALSSGLILNLSVGSIIIRKATARFYDQIRGHVRGLDKGGFYIGLLERALVMLLVLINQPAGVGFLITAKSILRFGDVKDSKQRKATEYIIIGTFMSFGWGLLTAALTQAAIKHWMG
jgi:hypothetical protein